jgi:hypothetical protein
MTDGGGVAVVLAVLQQDRLDVRLTFQDTEEFRPGVAAIADNTNWEFHLFDYSFLRINIPQTTRRVRLQWTGENRERRHTGT